MTFLVSTLRTDSTEQIGLATNTFAGAGSMHNALADSSDASYARFSARARLDTQVARLGVQAPVLIQSDRVYSVGVRARIRSVVAGSDTPLLLGWLRTESGGIVVDGETPLVNKTPFEVYAPVSALTSEWVDIDLGQFTAAPGGLAWDQNGNLANLSVELGRGDDYAPALDVAALFFDVYYQQVGTVAVTGPSTGTATRPTVTWTYDSPNYAPQQGYRVAIYTQAQTVEPDFVAFTTPAQFISGEAGSTQDTSWWLLGEDQRWVPSGDLTDGTFVVYVQATSQWAGGGGDFYTAIASRTWTRNGAAAGPPSAASLTSAAYSYDDMRTWITFEPGGGSPAATAFTVERRTDGVVWAPASPGLTHIPANGSNPITVGDRFAPLNALAEYRVIAYAGAPLVAAQSPSSVLAVTPADDRHILRHPTNDLLDVAITVQNPRAEGVKRTKRRMQGAAYFTGGPNTRVLPVMTWGPTYGWEYDLTLLFVRVEDPDLWAKVDQLDEASCPLYLQFPTGETAWGGLGPGAAGRDTEEALHLTSGNSSKYSMIRRKTMFTECVAPANFV